MSRRRSMWPAAGSSSLSRRVFLQRLGMVGGSSLVMGAMNALDLMGAPAGPRPTLSGRGEGTRILVLGAGISGLTAAHELVKLGYDVQVLEARDRVGGVAWAVRRGDRVQEIDGEEQVCNFDEGQYFNAGPWRIPTAHTAVLNYCRELGVATELFVNENDAGLLYFQNPQMGPLAGTRVRMREVKADMRGYSAELLVKAMDQGALDLPLTPEDRERFVQYLVLEGYLDTADGGYKGGAGRGDAGAPHDLSALLQSGFGNRFRSTGAVTFGFQGSWFQPVGGMDQIPAGFARVLGDRITLGAVVRSIRQTEDGVRVVHTDPRGGREEEATADYCISCLPLSVLRGLDVPLESGLAAVVGEVNYSNSAKIGLQMGRRFWEEDEGIYGGPTFTDLPLGQFSYPSNGFHTKKGVLLGMYGGSGLRSVDGRTLLELSNRERLEHVVSNVSRFHPQAREEFEAGFCAFWQRIPYSQGAYATGTSDLVSRLSEPSGRLYLGCAALSDAPAWLEGAISAAWGVVERVHGRVQKG